MKNRIDAQNKRLNKLEKRVNNIVINRRTERAQGDRRMWWGVGSPLIGIGIFIIIKNEDLTGKLFGAFLITAALYFMIVMGTALGDKFDLWVFDLISKLKRFFSKSGRLFRKLGRKLSFRKEA